MHSYLTLEEESLSSPHRTGQPPFFSVVIPAYNAENFIRETLDSVRLQTLNDYEVIIVNDGSKDNTSGAVKAYFDQYPQLRHRIVNQSNRGIGAARNSGIKSAEGLFVAFLDVDDIWYKEKLSRVKAYLDGNPQVDLLCHDEYLAENKRVLKRLSYGPHTAYRQLLFRGNSLSTSAVTVRRKKLFEAGLFSENLDFNSAEDYELWLRLSKIGRIAYLKEVLGIYNIYGHNITRKNILRHVKNSLNVMDWHFAQWQDKSFYYRGMLLVRKAATIKAAVSALLRKRQL